MGLMDKMKDGMSRVKEAVVKTPVAKRVLITGAAGQIGYALAPMVAAGDMLGPKQPVILHLLDLPFAEKRLEALRMELIDSAFPLLHDVIATTDLDTACAGVDVAVLVGGFPRGPGMERADLMAKNAPIFGPQGAALNQHASSDVKILVVANPANTNAWIVAQHAPNIPRRNITAMTRLDHNRARGKVADMLRVPNHTVQNVIIWGNHSSTQVPDVAHGTVGGKPIPATMAEHGHDGGYLATTFRSDIQQRGKAVIEARGASSALSAAHSACDHIHDWVTGTRKGEFVSMAVFADETSYGVGRGVCYSFPVTCHKGEWTVVAGLGCDAETMGLMQKTYAELQEEQKEAMEALGQGQTSPQGLVPGQSYTVVNTFKI